MPRKKQEIPTYFSPKSGTIKKVTVKKKLFKHCIETLAKAKTKNLVINGDIITAHTEGYDFTAPLDMGDLSCEVPTKEFLEAAKLIGDIEGVRIIPDYEKRELTLCWDGNLAVIPMAPPPDNLFPTGHPVCIGEQDHNFAECFFVGGAGCGQVPDYKLLDVVSIDGNCVRSSDGWLASESLFHHSKGREILIDGSVYRLFRSLDLPFISFDVYELSVDLTFEGEFVITCPQLKRTPPNGLRDWARYWNEERAVAIPLGFWKILKSFKGLAWVDIEPTGLVKSSNNKQFDAEFLTGLPTTFRINPDRLARLESLTCAGTRFNFNAIPVDEGRPFSCWLTASDPCGDRIIVSGKIRKV